MSMEVIMPQRGNLLTMPFDIARRGQTYLGSFFRGSASVFLSPETPEQHVVKMLREQPMHEVSLGVNAMHRGKELMYRSEEPEENKLIIMGRLMVAGAVLKAEESRVVPDTITARVVDRALEEDVYPAVIPYLPVPAVDRTKQVLEKYDPARNVIPLFPNRDN